MKIGANGSSMRRHRRAQADRLLAHAVERGAAHLHQPVQLLGLVHAVGPLLGARVDVGVLVGEVAQVLRPRVVDDRGQRRRLVDAGRELPVAEVDRHLVPVADPRLVGLRDVDGAVGLQLLERVRIVHHRDPALGAVVVVVAEAEGVADLVRGELADAGQRRLVELRRPLAAGLVRRQQPLEDHVVLAVAQRAERDRGLDDLAGARVAMLPPVLQPRVERCTQLIML